jgi:coniferyl-aldehyde dehydrogenase
MNALQSTLEAQRKAYLLQPVPTLAQRRNDLRQLARLIKDNQPVLVDAVSRDYGYRSRHETLLMEIAPALAATRHAERRLKQWMRPEWRPVDRLTYGLVRNQLVPQPLGIVGVIVPWNFPVNLSFVPLSSIFAAGNRAMVKLSENSRHLARALLDIAPRYFPADKLQFFDETGGVGVEFSALAFDHLLFTGSSSTGRAVMAAAARNLCPVTLELGGKAPAILCEDFDAKLAADRILMIKCLNAGQICTTVDHVFVPRSRLSEFVAAARTIVPQRYRSLDSADYTSIIDQRSFERLIATLNDARARGTEVIPLLPEPLIDSARHRLAPQLLLDPPRESQAMQREIFGPLLPVLPYDSLDEVIHRINAAPRPLAIYPFTNDKQTLAQIIEFVMSGGVTVNDALIHVGQDDLPFGGVGESGIGHYHGIEGFHRFSKLRPICYQSRWSSVSLLAPPFGKLADRVLAFLTR